MRGASDSVTDSSVLSNSADTQNVSCLGLSGTIIFPKTYVSYGLDTFLSLQYLYSKKKVE